MPKRGTLRIIGGQWRSRLLHVLEETSMRPTPSRVRETLFNWLAPLIQNTTCLDLFAGSGILGFEALSRGATSVIFCDRSFAAVQLLQKELVRFCAQNQASVYHTTIIPNALLHLTAQFKKRFDIVFLDPPYDSTLLLACCANLEQCNILSDPAYIYLEARRIISDNELPTNWHLLKCKQAGQVIYHLARRN